VLLIQKKTSFLQLKLSFFFVLDNIIWQ